MSKKTSPQSRPSRRPRGRVSGPQAIDRGRRATARARKKDTREQASVPTTLGGRLRRYLPVVAVPNVVVVLGIIVLALAGLMLSSTTLTALPATVAQLWLVLNLVPVVADGVELGVLPMLPTLGLIALIARRVHKAVKHRVSIADLAVLAACTLLVPVVFTLVAAAMMWDAGRVFAVGPPPLGEAVPRTFVVHLSALVLGMGPRLWRALLRRYGLPGWLVDVAAHAGRFLRWLAGGALILLVVLLITGWQRQLNLLADFGGAGDVVALVVISLLYLPNALIATSGVLMGSEFNLGEASVSLFSIHLVPLPALPLMAVIPGTAHDWAVALLVVPALLAVVLAYRTRPTAAQALGGGASAAVIMFVLCFLTRGEIGYYGTSGPMLWLTPALAFVWVAGAGLAVAGAVRIAELRQRVSEAEDKEEEEEEELAQESREVEDAEGAEPAEPSEGEEVEMVADGPEGTESTEGTGETEDGEEGEEGEDEAESGEVSLDEGDGETEPGEETGDAEDIEPEVTVEEDEASGEASPTEGGEEPGEDRKTDPRG